MKNKLEEGDVLEENLNRDSKKESLYYADGAVKLREIGECIQFQRIANLKIDKRYYEGETLITEGILIPSGKTTGMSNIKTKVSAADTAQGTGSENKQQ